MYVGRGGPGLGLLSPTDAFSTVTKALSYFQSVDPVKDAQRMNRLNLASQLALAGDNTPHTTTDPNTNLGGMTGAQYLQYIATNNNGAGSPGTGVPVYGSTAAYKYAQTLWSTYQANVASAIPGVTGPGGILSPGGLLGPSTPTIIGGTAYPGAGGVSPLVLIGIAGLGLFMLTRKPLRRGARA